MAFIVVFVFSAVDHRFAWSRVPPYTVASGDILVVLGLLIIFVVFKENTFTSAVIEIDTEQKVISTGPYAFVRHPMYLGALVMLLGVPLPALGSWWGLLTIIPITLVIIWRLLDEEQFLAKKLSGYSEYPDKVTYRASGIAVYFGECRQDERIARNRGHVRSLHRGLTFVLCSVARVCLRHRAEHMALLRCLKR